LTRSSGPGLTDRGKPAYEIPPCRATKSGSVEGANAESRKREAGGMSNVKIPMSNGRGGRVEDSRGKIQGSMLKRGATQGDCLANPSTLSLFSPFTLAKCETSWALHRVINLMAHGLHNWALSRVFPEFFRTWELGNLGTWDLQIHPNFGTLRDNPPLCFANLSSI
jgi:hypothetical protein